MLPAGAIFQKLKILARPPLQCGAACNEQKKWQKKESVFWNRFGPARDLYWAHPPKILAKEAWTMMEQGFVPRMLLALVLACIAFAAMVTKGDVTLTLVFTGRP